MYINNIEEYIIKNERLRGNFTKVKSLYILYLKYIKYIMHLIYATQEVSVFQVILVRIFRHSD